MQEYTTRLGDAPLGRLLMKLSLPGMAATISTSLYNIVDTIWVARIGFEAIAALTIVFPYQILYWAIGGGTGTGIAALVSRRFGEKNPEATNHAAGQIFFLSAFWGLLFILVAFFFHDPILLFLGARPDIMEYSQAVLCYHRLWRTTGYLRHYRCQSHTRLRRYRETDGYHDFLNAD